MNKTKITLIIALILLLGGFLAYSFVNMSEETKITDVGGEGAQKDTASIFPVQISEEGPVTVSIQPLIANIDTQELWEFDVVLSTHSVDLAYDMTELAVLVDTQGKEYKPRTWTGDPLGGHHREGVLAFEQTEPMPSELTILVRDVGDVAERKFMWTISP